MRSVSAVGGANRPSSCASVSARRLGMAGCPSLGVICLLRPRPVREQGLAGRAAEGVQLGQQGQSPHRAALYCRVSTADQSCARQERDLAAFAERAGYEVVGTYKETASGVRLDRAERKRVLALAQRREIDAVLVTELSR